MRLPAPGRPSTRRAQWLLLAGLLGCSDPTAAQGPRAPNPDKILFVGNSLTYTNDLPEMVRALGETQGLRGWTVESVTLPGVSLEDHWQHGLAEVRIAEGGWDLVIMQQGPSSLLSSRALLIEYAGRFTTLIRRIGGRPAFYMVWPSQDRPQDFDGVTASYTAAADSLDGMLFPGGEAWRAAWRRDPTLALYSSDQLHPTPLGTYVVALVMVSQLTGRSPIGMPSSLVIGGTRLDVPPGVARIVQEAAAEAIRNFGRE